MSRGRFWDINQDVMRSAVALAFGQVKITQRINDDDIANILGVDRKTVWRWRNAQHDITALDLARASHRWPKDFAPVKTLICGVAK